MKADINDIKKLRAETSASVLDIKKALEAADGDLDKARQLLNERGQAIAAKKSATREVKAGLVESYVHSTGKVGSLVELLCETDFVARNDAFKTLAHEIAMQVAIQDYADVDELLDDAYIRDTSKTVRDLITEAIAKIGEKIELGRFIRYAVGE